jgi:hypothetical protein
LEDQAGDRFGISVLPAGDLNHDGYGDFAVMTLGGYTMVVNSDGHGSTSQPYPGRVLLYAGGPSPASTPFASIPAPVDHPNVNGGAIFDFDGDGLPELLVEQSTSPNTSGDINGQVTIYSGSNNYASLARVLPNFMANDDFGIAMSQ